MKKYHSFPVVSLWILAIVQIIAIGTLDGEHAFRHTYYFMGISFTASLIFLKLWQSVHMPMVKLVFLALFLGKFFDVHSINLNRLLPKNYVQSETPYAFCEALQKRNPEVPWGQGELFRMEDKRYPALGICFGERMTYNYGPAYGLFDARDAVPLECETIDQEGFVLLTRCLAGAKTHETTF
jgi:hypothetical protein